MPRQVRARYDIIVKNKTGELTKLAKVLTIEGVDISEITISSVDGISSVQISAPIDSALPDKLRRHGHKVLEHGPGDGDTPDTPKVVRDLFRSLVRRGLRVDSVYRSGGRKKSTILTVDKP
ncbi:MAG: hypothetical protein HY078_00545 [Elusimicrobia bacterium]|nr:hypothetical protein [Elusimicrobiota bacterium]